LNASLTSRGPYPPLFNSLCPFSHPGFHGIIPGWASLLSSLLLGPCLAIFPGILQKPSCEDHLPEALAQVQTSVNNESLCYVFQWERLSLSKQGDKVSDSQLISGRKPLQVIFVNEFQGEDTEIDEVGPVNAGNRLCKYRSNTSEAGCQGCMFSA
jgi:hypothetical protein